MTVAEWCVFAVVALYLLTIVSVKWIGARQYDNAQPRDPAFYQEGIRTASRPFHSLPRPSCSPNFGPLRRT